MLSKLRDYSSYFLWFVVITFVGFMAFSGVQECGSEPYQRGIIAEINGQPITLAAYNAAVSRALQNKQQDGTELTEDEISQVREQAWQQMIGALLLDQETAKRNITVTDDELAGFLKRYPPQDLQQTEIFQTDGKFDYQKYVTAMTNTSPQFTSFWKSIESYWRPQLKTSKLQQQIVSTVRVTDSEVADYFHANNDQARVEFLLVNASVHNSEIGTPPEDSVKAYYEQESSRYLKGDRAQMELMIWRREPSQADKDWAHQQIVDLKNQLDEGASFETLAEQYGMDGTAANGGDLGWFGKGAMVKPFEDAVFALKPGEISDPVETQFGWHLIKLEETRKSEKNQGETEVRARHILIRPEVSQSTLDSIYRAADDFAVMARDGQAEFDRATATALGAQSLTTSYVQQTENIPTVGTAPSLKSWAFNAKPGDISGVIDEGGKYIVARLVDRRKPGVAGFDEVKTTAMARYIAAKARELSRPQADSLLAACESGTPMKNLDTAGNVAYSLTDPFTRNGTVSQVGRSPIFMGTVFSMSAEDPWSDPIPVPNGWAIVHLLELNIAPIEALAAVRDSLSSQVLQQKQSNVYTEWFVQVYENSDIKDYRSDMTGSAY